MNNIFTQLMLVREIVKLRTMHWTYSAISSETRSGNALVYDYISNIVLTTDNEATSYLSFP